MNTELITLLNKALSQVPNSKDQLKTKEQINKILCVKKDVTTV